MDELVIKSVQMWIRLNKIRVRKSTLRKSFVYLYKVAKENTLVIAVKDNIAVGITYFPTARKYKVTIYDSGKEVTNYWIMI